MRKNSAAWFPMVALACVLPMLGSCDKVKTVVANLAKNAKAAKEKSAGTTGTGTYDPAQVSEVTKADFPTFIARKNALVVIDFTATWCGPCKALGPVLVKATEAHPGVVYLGKVDVDRERDLAIEHKVSGVPDVRIYKDGKEVDRFVGFIGESETLEKIAGLAQGIVPAAPAPATEAAAAPAAQSDAKPFTKDWLPPGMSRSSQSNTVPVPQSQTPPETPPQKKP